MPASFYKLNALLTPINSLKSMEIIWRVLNVATSLSLSKINQFTTDKRAKQTMSDILKYMPISQLGIHY